MSVTELNEIAHHIDAIRDIPDRQRPHSERAWRTQPGDPIRFQCSRAIEELYWQHRESVAFVLRAAPRMLAELRLRMTEASA